LNKQSYRRIAFTLAEVLITLTIIGVVAAMTIPTLMKNVQNQQYVTSLKKAYTTTNQALQQMALDYGCSGDLKCTGLFASTGTSHLTLGTALVKYFKVTKDCTNQNNQGCLSDVTNYYYDGSYTGASPANPDYDALYSAYKFITADGMSFYIFNYMNNCDTPTWSTGRTGNMTQTCGIVLIDVNGLKKPNTLGRDTFYFFISNGKGALLYPWGGADDNYDWAAYTDGWWNNGSGVARRCLPSYKWGTQCAGRIMEEGWQMNY